MVRSHVFNMLDAKMITIGALSREVHIKPETIRYFEKIKMMSKAYRSDNGYRQYDKHHVRQLKFIQRCRNLGFSQKDIRDLVDVFEHAQSHTRAHVKDITLNHLQNTRRKISELQRLQSALDKLIQQCDGGHKPANECPILASLSLDVKNLTE